MNAIPAPIPYNSHVRKFSDPRQSANALRELRDGHKLNSSNVLGPSDHIDREATQQASGFYNTVQIGLHRELLNHDSHKYDIMQIRKVTCNDDRRDPWVIESSD
jgi:hypothetical protein